MRAFIPFSFGCVALVSLVGCQTVPVASSEGTQTTEAGAAQTPAPTAPQSSSAANMPAPPQGASPTEYLSGQITLLQEQSIQIRADVADIKQNQQILLANQQLIAQTGRQPNNPPANPAAAPASQENAGFSEVGLQRLTTQVETILDHAAPTYGMTSGYTVRGQWVMIRYNRTTGESWLADNGRWNLLSDLDSLPTAQYEVQLLRAENDVKGYVAARIDLLSGDTWWLKQDTWVKFQ